MRVLFRVGNFSGGPSFTYWLVAESGITGSCGSMRIVTVQELERSSITTGSPEPPRATQTNLDQLQPYKP